MTIHALGVAGSIPQWNMADRLRKARESAQLEQSDLVEVTGLSRTTISAYENGHVAPRKSNLRLWAMATGVPVSWLENGDTPRGPNRPPRD